MLNQLEKKLLNLFKMCHVRFLSFRQHYLRIFNRENNKHNNQTQETIDTNISFGETIKEKTPQLPQR